MEFFNNLPSEIVADILSRLPVQAIISCRCVHKSWLHLIDTHEVVKSRLSKSLPGIFASQNKEEGSVLHRFFEFEEEIVTNTGQDYDDFERHKLHYSPATPWFEIPCHEKIMIGSANGLLFWHNDSFDAKDLFICNPFTREYIKVPCAQDSIENHGPEAYLRGVTYGFGVSNITGRHKVLRALGMQRIGLPKFEYQVYTLGTGSWRRIDPSRGGLFVEHDDIFPGPFVFLNGNLHWLSTIFSPYIFSLNLETELFSNSGCPLPLPVTLKSKDNFSLCVLRDALCICDSTNKDEIVVWLVKEDKFWVREFVFRHSPPGHFYCPSFWLPVRILNVFKDGDILVEWFKIPLFTRPEKIETWDWLKCLCSVIIHTPSFLSLRSFELENVISY